MKKRAITAVCALCLTVGLTISAAAAGPFTDVPDTAWYAKAVQEAAQKGYMAGIGDGVFGPRGIVSRATVVTVLWRMEGSPTVSAPPAFDDVAADAWYSDAVAWGQAQKVASGDGKGKFSPDSPVTREQLAVFLYNYAKLKQSELTTGVLELYSDQKKISSWAVDAMRHAVGAGLIEGSGTALNPTGAATRAELAVILQRLATPAVG